MRRHRIQNHRGLKYTLSALLAILHVFCLEVAASARKIAPGGFPPISDSSVTFPDANWADDGTGALPLGNGDVTASVWISNSTGALTLTVTKSDAFDENAQPVKVGLFRVYFDPPLNVSAVRTTLNLTAASVDIVDDGYDGGGGAGLQIRVYVDYHVDTVRIQAAVPGREGESRRKFRARVEADLSIRPSQVQPTELGWGFCRRRFDRPDDALGVHDDDRPTALRDAVVFYHNNSDNSSVPTYFEESLAGQGVDPTEWDDPYRGLVFGGALVSPQLRLTDSTTLSMPGDEATDGGFSELTVEATLCTHRANVSEWIKALAIKAEEAEHRREVAQVAHLLAWKGLWDRSWVRVTSRRADDAAATSDAKLINDHLAWRRFMDIIQARKATYPIKFNGESFTANFTGKGFDARIWGDPYWWQNTRQPYFNAIASGDDDVFKSMAAHYHRMLPLVKARTAAQYAETDAPVLDGAFYPETTTAFGMFNPRDWGCNSPQPREDGASANGYIRYHYTGSLELSFLLLDHYEHRLDLDMLQKYTIPIVTAVLNAFRERFPHRNVTTGKTDFFPIQCLETYQCPQPHNRSACPTNPADIIAGLQAVLERALALPDGTVSEDVRSKWRAQIGSLPSLALTADGRKILPAASGTSQRRNSENTVLYLTHPFRLYSVGKPGLDIIRNTYRDRLFPCNVGWCYDIVAAAMIGDVDGATSQLVDRIRQGAGDPPLFRFLAFSSSYQDYAPSLDHYSTAATAVHRMLLMPVDDENATILLFPSWPSDKWAVDFKLFGPRNMTVEASCIGGKVTKLKVNPPDRQKDVKVLRCGGGEMLGSSFAQGRVTATY